jgi:hypothetical protein
MGQIALFVILACLALAAREAWKIHLGQASTLWERTTGVLHKVWVADSVDLYLGEQDPFGDHEGTHSVHAHYRYQVGTQWYDSKRLTYRLARWIRFREALAMIDGLRVGREVEVWYDPRKPSRAVLIPGSSTGNIVMLTTYLVVASILLFTWLR